MSLVKQKEKAKNKIFRFAQKWGQEHLDLACHAAFPLAITPELLYCLRENFLPQSPWIAVADIILSPLCDSVGDELYEMDGVVRDLLLKILVGDSRFAEERLNQLADFMGAYIEAQLPTYPRADSDLGKTPEWVALAYIHGEDAQRLRQRLEDLLRAGNGKIRQRLANFLEDEEDLLIAAGLEPLMMEVSHQWHLGLDLELETIEVEVATFGEEEELSKLEFATVFVNKRGEIIERKQCEAYYYDQPLLIPPNPVNKTAKHPLSPPFLRGVRGGSKGGDSTSQNLRMIYIPEGEFWMGSPEDEEGRFDDESPQHKVTVNSFFMSQTPITEAQWRFVANLPQEELKLNSNLSSNGDNHPVYGVPWEDAMEFCARLSRYTGQNYRLPSEAEWEYACRAVISNQLSVISDLSQEASAGVQIQETPFTKKGGGDQIQEAPLIKGGWGDQITLEEWNDKYNQPFHFGETITSELANYNGEQIYKKEPKGEYRKKTTSVGIFTHNAFGLYDMHGNVWEWCLDPWHENYEGAPNDGRVWHKEKEELYEGILTNLKVLLQNSSAHVRRGGSWDYYPWSCRSAFRGYVNYPCGLRVVRGSPRTP